MVKCKVTISDKDRIS